MTDAPELIWAVPEAGSEDRLALAAWDEHKDVLTDDMGWVSECRKYIRSDLSDQAIADAYARGVADARKVKPLVWEGSEDDCFVTASTMIGEYELVVFDALERPQDYVWRARLCTYADTNGESINCPKRANFDTAKAAAQADYERRIQSALVDL